MLARSLAIVLLCAVPASAEKPKEAKHKPVRVLLVAGHPSLEYQFVRTLLVRETDKKRAELSIYLQAATGEAPRTDVDQAVPPERLLAGFPDLAIYDVIVTFDADWSRLSAEQQKLLRQWVEKGGGLIVVAGPLHTSQLAAPASAEKLKLVNDLLPVNVADSRLMLERKTEHPFRLTFVEGKTDVPFLKLGDDADKPLAFWDAYFGAEKEATRGFYSCYPVKSIKPTATVYARFGDTSLKMNDGGATPYLVTMPVARGRTAYLGSGEMWRLRRFDERLHERFWNGLIAYVLAK